MQPNAFLDVNANKVEYMHDNTHITEYLCIKFKAKKAVQGRDSGLV